MEANWVDHSKKEIYFLEWLAQASGFTEEQILENMKPENQKWISSYNKYVNIEEYQKKDIYAWVGGLFYWRRSILNTHDFWNEIDEKWKRIYRQFEKNNYKFIFSKYPILNWKIQKYDYKNLKKNKLKIKNKKIKI